MYIMFFNNFNFDFFESYLNSDMKILKSIVSSQNSEFLDLLFSQILMSKLNFNVVIIFFTFFFTFFFTLSVNTALNASFNLKIISNKSKTQYIVYEHEKQDNFYS